MHFVGGRGLCGESYEHPAVYRCATALLKDDAMKRHGGHSCRRNSWEIGEIFSALAPYNTIYIIAESAAEQITSVEGGV